MTDRHIAAGGRPVSLAGPLRRAVVTVVLAAVVAVGCGAGPSPEVPLGPDGQPDPTLELGRVVYGEQCSNCHGNEGQGGRGKPINGGRALERYPDVADMIAVITEGKGSGMPKFESKLTTEEIAAVTEYVREILN